MNRGKLIAIEGVDRIGKETQAKMLCDYFNNELKEETIMVSFPNYNTPQAQPVEFYLRGEYELLYLTPEEVAMLFSFEKSVTFREMNLRKRLLNGTNVICDRYIASNAIFQTASSLKKTVCLNDSAFFDIATAQARKILELDTKFLNLPEADITIYLEVDQNLSNHLSDSVNREKDINEKDNTLQCLAREVGNTMAIHLNWIKIKCDNARKIYSKETIHRMIVDSLFTTFEDKE